MSPILCCSTSFFFNDTATTEIYTLSLHDALPISYAALAQSANINLPAQNFSSSIAPATIGTACDLSVPTNWGSPSRSEEHTSELQSRLHLVCRLLLEKKKRDHERSYDIEVRTMHS